MASKNDTPVTASNLEAYVQKYGGGSGGITDDNFWDDSTFHKFQLPYRPGVDTKTYIRTVPYGVRPTTYGSYNVGAIAFEVAIKTFITDEDFIGSYSYVYSETFAMIQKLLNVQAYTSCRADALRAFYSPYLSTMRINGGSYVLTLSSIYMSNLINIPSSFFKSCGLLEHVNFPKVSNISPTTFYTCSALKSVNLPNVSIIGSAAFAGCKSLESVNFPRCSVLARSCFWDCGLKIATFGIENNSYTGTIDSNAFSLCRSLESLYLSGKYNFGYNAMFSNVFYMSPMVDTSYLHGRYGSIYVPRSFYSYYANHSLWKQGISRFVSF